jgi:nucleoside-diphosphate-sugar epimerase
VSTIFFTGFPGFLGSALLPRVLERCAEDVAVCLVQGRFAAVARARVEALEAELPAVRGRIRLVEGDITRPGLGLADPAALSADVREVYHLAAIYDLSVTREAGLRVNVDGTRHVVDFAETAPRLARLHYASTCYVSGRHAGIFSEADLDLGQRFNNFYEETKLLAERYVRERMRAGLPVTVYRPAIVVGDSRTGATQKFDGPYFVLQLLVRQPRLAVMPVIGNPSLTRVNVVPCDFVVDAIAHLSGLPGSAGKVYQLADPAPLTADEMLRAMGHATRRTIVRVPLPRRLARAAIDRVPGVYRWLRVPSSALDYFDLPTHYTSTNTQADLAGTGIAVPPFSAYLGRLVAFMRSHPEVRSAAMA